jgi:hypothetical protein
MEPRRDTRRSREGFRERHRCLALRNCGSRDSSGRDEKGGVNQWQGTQGEGYRRGEVRDRSQFRAPNGNWVKRDDETGRILDQKQDGQPFKGVRREKHDKDA